MSLRKHLLAASISLTTICAMAQTSWAGTVTFDTTTGTFVQSTDSNSTFSSSGGPTVTTENGVRVFTFDRVELLSDMITVIGNAPLIVRSRTNMLIDDTDVEVLPGNAGGGAGGAGSAPGSGGSGGAGGAGGEGGDGAGFELDIGTSGTAGTDGLTGTGSRVGGSDGESGFGGTTAGSGGARRTGTSVTGDGGNGGAAGARNQPGVNGQNGDNGINGQDGGNGTGGTNFASGRALTGGAGGGGGAGGAGGSGGGGGGGGGGGSEKQRGIFQDNGLGGGPGGDGGDGGDGGHGGDGGAGGGAIAFEALGLLRVSGSTLSANGESGQLGSAISDTPNAGESGFRTSSGGNVGHDGGAGGRGGDGGLGGKGGTGGGGAGGTVKLSASVLDIDSSLSGRNRLTTFQGLGDFLDGGTFGSGGRFLVESNTGADLSDIDVLGVTAQRIETFSGPRGTNEFILGNVETPFMLLSQASSLDSDVGLSGFLSDTDASDLLAQNLVSGVPTGAVGAITRLDNGFGGGDFIGFDVLLFSNLTEEIVSGAGLGVDPLSGGTGFLTDLPLDMAGLSVFATLIPEDGTTFSAAFGELGIFDVELALGETQFILSSVTTVPLPAALPLLGFGIAGLILVKRRRR